MTSASLSAIEREIIADIHAVCRRCGWPTDVRPTFEAYLERRGHFYEKQIKRLGGWKKLCALGGMRTTRLVPDARPEVVAAEFERVVADVRAVAQALRLKPGAPLTYAAYYSGGGLYHQPVISKLGGWIKLSAAAGVPSRRGGNARSVRCQRREIRPALSVRELDAALDHLLGRKPVPPGIRRMVGPGRRMWRRAHVAVHREVAVLERGEVIADLRQVALSLGLLSPRLLRFETYRRHGGRYTYEQTLTVGGFDTLRRVA